MIIEGGVSVKAALLAGRRTINCIYLDEKRHDKDAHFIERKSEELHVPFKKVSRETIEEMATGRTHGGLVADVEGRNMQTLEDCLNAECPFVVVVEGVEDPFNLGYVMRSLYSAGCSGIILRKRDWSHVETTILRSSAGASEYINTVMVDHVEDAITSLKEKGLIAYAAMRKDAIPYFEADFNQPMVLAIGGEMRGLSSKVLKTIDQNLYIPYANDFRNALNAAGASAALGFEVVRQRKSY